MLTRFSTTKECRALKTLKSLRGDYFCHQSQSKIIHLTQQHDKLRHCMGVQNQHGTEAWSSRQSQTRICFPSLQQNKSFKVNL